MLELEDIQNNLVGSIGDSGLSLEEAKRLTIGKELVSDNCYHTSILHCS